MRKIVKSLLPLCALLIAATSVGCDKDTDKNAPGGGEVVAPSIGKYFYDNVPQEIIFGKFIEDNDTYQFIFSPQDGTKMKLSQYFVIQIKSYFDGRIINTEDVAHNDDYTFIYEDFEHYYAPHRKVFGTIQITRSGKSNFAIKLDFKLADGKPFTADFTAKL